MISVEVALERVLAGCRPVAAEMVPLPAALGRVLAEDVAAQVAHPPLDVAAMDGYAVRAADLEHTDLLTVVGLSAAGQPFAGTVGSGQAVRVFTGAALPAGADAVVMQEDCERDGNLVVVELRPAPGQYVRRRGMDFVPGQVGLNAGTTMGPRQIALAAAMNVPWLNVRRRPRVAVLSTGDEITMPGMPLALAQLPSCNGPGIAALVAALGGEPLQLGIAGDSRESLSSMVTAAAGCDLLVTSGGASVGDYDLVQDVLADHGMKLDFWKIAMRPGKPLMFGTLKSVPVLGLPGNPVSAMVCGYVFLAPLLRALQGVPGGLPLVPAVLGTDLRANDARQDYVRATLGRNAAGVLLATPHERQDSAVVSGLAAANGFVVRSPHAPAAQAGDTVKVMVLPDGL